jgi:hypothetical protein
MSNLILYTTDDGKCQIQLRADLGSVWLTQLEMADDSVVKHWLTTDVTAHQRPTVKNSLTVQIHRKAKRLRRKRHE